MRNSPRCQSHGGQVRNPRGFHSPRLGRAPKNLNPFGKLFLATEIELIDMAKGKLKFRVQKEEITFLVYDSSKKLELPYPEVVQIPPTDEEPPLKFLRQHKDRERSRHTPTGTLKM